MDNVLNRINGIFVILSEIKSRDVNFTIDAVELWRTDIWSDLMQKPFSTWKVCDLFSYACHKYRAAALWFGALGKVESILSPLIYYLLIIKI